jgi:hypothetical protein
MGRGRRLPPKITRPRTTIKVGGYGHWSRPEDEGAVASEWQ